MVADAAPEEVPVVAPVPVEVEGDGVPGLVCDVLLLPALPVVPEVPVVPEFIPVVVPDAVVPDVVVPDVVVPELVTQGPLCVVPMPFGFVVEGCEVVPDVGVFGGVEPGTLWLVMLPGGVAVLPCGVAVLPCGVAVLPDGEAV